MPTPISQDAKKSLQDKIQQCDTLSHEEKSTLYGLLSERKRYGLVWEDKPEQAYEQLRTQIPVFTEVPERRIMGSSADAPNHILIEGDNLHALTAMQYTHAGKVDVIYIDPPYNTGNKDFSYQDSFKDEPDWIGREHLFRHSTWLSFMEKRLKLAKTLLKETGVIFISIDDNEQAQLKILCDKLFAENNFIGMFPWRSRTAKADVPFGVSVDVEWVLAYTVGSFIAGRDGERKYFKTDDCTDRWRLQDSTTNKSKNERPNSFFTMVNPRNNAEYPADENRTWCVTVETFPSYVKQKKIVFPGDYPFLKIKRPAFRVFEQEDKSKAKQKFGTDDIQMSVSTYLDDKTIGRTETGTQELRAIFNQTIFGYPKPTTLIKFFINTCRNDSALILDFFAGSGTTLHATMALNAEDGGKRQCILVTNNENEICEKVTYERNKRVIQGYTNSKGEQVPGLTDNSLRYYRTEFVTREISLRNRFELTRKTLDLLCVKEDCYTPRNDLSCQEFQVFEATAFMLFLVLNPDSIDDVIQVIASQTKRCKVYVHSPDADPFSMDFDEICDKIELHALPDSFHRALREFLPDTNTDSVETAENQDD